MPAPAARASSRRAPAKRQAPPPSLIQPVAPPLLAIATIERLLARAMGRGAEFAEVYVEHTTTTAISFEEGKVRSGQVSISQGVGIRAVVGAQVGYAHSDDLSDAALDRAASTAALIAAGKANPGPFQVNPISVPKHFRVPVPLASIELAKKVALVERVDAAARKYDKRVQQVMASYVDQTKRILVANTAGLLAENLLDMCRLNAHVVVVDVKSGERRTGSYGGGGRLPFTHFETFTPEAVGSEAARQAVAMLGAVDAPAGPQTVVLAPGWSGILLHEAIGHGLEADFIRKKTSAFTGKVGERVASPGVTVIDDGTVAGARGSIDIDDEGTPAQRKVLIEDGILKGYLYDSLNAKLLGMASTGSGRRESYRHAPLPRMTNTHLAPGKLDPAEIVGSVERGLYCKNFGGGQVDITNGNFVFEVTEAYLIEKGRLTAPVKGATLIGLGHHALKSISMVGCDPTLDPGMGTCGKDGQSVPVGVGLPTVRLDDMTVGGTRVARGGKRS